MIPKAIFPRSFLISNLGLEVRRKKITGAYLFPYR